MNPVTNIANMTFSRARTPEARAHTHAHTLQKQKSALYLYVWKCSGQTSHFDLAPAGVCTPVQHLVELECKDPEPNAEASGLGILPGWSASCGEAKLR